MNSFYCQRRIEDDTACETQCDDCLGYYKPLDTDGVQEAAKGEAMWFAEFIARGNYEFDIRAGGLTYWNEVPDPQLHGEDGPECFTTHQLYLLYKKQNP